MSGSEVQAARADAAKTQLANVYARAFVAAADKSGGLDGAADEFYSLVFDVVQKQPDFQRILLSPSTSSGDKQQLFERILGQRVSRMVLNFLKTIAEHNRLDCLREIAISVRERVHELRGRARVQVQTAEALDQPMRQRIAEVLAKVLQKDVVLEESVDPELLGGLVVRLGDQVIDGSVRHRLECIRQDALSRARQEIQSTSQRFAVV
ncbi:MAG: ATP synthase F1 subunit delta [Planctomycetota bacterium]|nr:ATP synthase F1 subunit delta [Planctomycetota bacterium]